MKKFDFVRPSQTTTKNYLDWAATSLPLSSAILAGNSFSLLHHANPMRGVYDGSAKATEHIEKVRSKIARFANIKASHVLMGAGATALLNIFALSWGLSTISRRDVLITEQEHHSNYLPWVEWGRSLGFKVHIAPVKKNGELDLDWIERALARNPIGLIAYSAMSNVLGFENPMQEIKELASKFDAYTLLDACQAAPSVKSIWTDNIADIVIMSTHKVYGLMGLGIALFRTDLHKKLKPSFFGGGMVRSSTDDPIVYATGAAKWEAGTLNASAISAFEPIVDSFESLLAPDMYMHKKQLIQQLVVGMDALNNFTIVGPRREDRTLLSFVHHRLHPHDIATLLDENGIGVRAGHLCAQPLLQAMGYDSVCRVSVGPSTDSNQIKHLLEVLERIA